MEREQIRQSQLFSEYLVLACWKKIHRRMSHWSSIALLHSLFELKPHAADFSVINAAPSDALLASALRKFSAWGGRSSLKRYINQSDTPDLPLPFPELFEAAVKPSGILWGEHTILSFHQFLVALTLAYARALNLLKVTMEDSTSKMWEKKTRISMVLNFSRLLSAVVYSYAFKFHLELLGAANLLRVPSQLYLSDLPIFAERHGISYTNPPQSKMKHIAREVDQDPVDQDPVDQQPVDQEPTDEEVMASSDAHLPVDHLAAVFCNRFRLFVGHFGAKRILEKYSEKLTDPVEIKLLGIKAAPCERPSWDYLKDTMKLALEHHGHKLDLDLTPADKSLGGASNAKPFPIEPRHDARKILVKHRPSAGGKQLPIIKQFQLDVQKLRGHSSFAQVRWIASESSSNRVSTTYNLSLHCETILASLAALYQTRNLENNEELDHILEVYLVVSKKMNHLLIVFLQNIDRAQIGVSKLCCPSCWEFLEILRDDQPGQYAVRGRHSALFPVQLPQWLPRHLLEKMVNRFEALLSDKLLVKFGDHSAGPTTSGHVRKASFQSEHTNASGKSSSSLEFHGMPSLDL